ncbi:hypothetical protein Q8W37_04820 [Shimia thalassica]|uniref:hypothetical protein n=1 Tax=Shimia thalassica TaxID=1715693 RepID=UPI002734AFFC|nr:hypothetical protein [Shimia thalassica]MDP2579244.1 hypothetical protein [Shimia thalassica]
MTHKGTPFSGQNPTLFRFLQTGSALALSVVCLLSTPQNAAASDADKSPLTFNLGSGYSATLYGYVKADFLWDDGYDLGRTTSSIKSIGLPGGPAAGSFDNQQLDETRIGLKVDGPNGFFARLEGDFYGADTSLRWRHAYIDWYGVIVGQNWTNFMSVENLADTVDFQGSGAVPFARLPQIRYTYSGIKNTTLSASIEEDVSNDDDYMLTVAARYGFKSGMVRASAMTRDTMVGGSQVDGWGLNLSTVLNPWHGGTLKLNYTTGEGIADVLAAGLTGTALSIGGNAVGTDAVAVTVAHQVNDKLKLAATGSWVSLDQSSGTDTDSLTSVHLSAFYKVQKNTTLMLEYFTGDRKQGDGNSFEANRVQFAVKYDF